MFSNLCLTLYPQARHRWMCQSMQQNETVSVCVDIPCSHHSGEVADPGSQSRDDYSQSGTRLGFSFGVGFSPPTTKTVVLIVFYVTNQIVLRQRPVTRDWIPACGVACPCCGIHRRCTTVVESGSTVCGKVPLRAAPLGPFLSELNTAVVFAGWCAVLGGALHQIQQAQQ